MIDAEFLKVLACPETKEELFLVAPGLIERVNERVRAGDVVDREGKPVKELLSEGLMPRGGAYLYPVFEDIPVLLVEDSIPLASLGLEKDVTFVEPAAAGDA